MQVYDRGLKRRLPPMVDGDPRRIRMVYSLLFSLPGTPTLYYGEEIGMGEDLTPRAGWPCAPHAVGYRSGGPAPGRLIQRPAPDGYGPDHVNVRDQRRDPDSLWTFMQRSSRPTASVPSWVGRLPLVLPQPHREVLAHCCHWEGSSLVAVHNLSSRPGDDAAPPSRATTSSARSRLGSRTCSRTRHSRPIPAARWSSRRGPRHRWLRVRRDDRPGP